jgi:hypothetical protein
MHRVAFQDDIHLRSRKLQQMATCCLPWLVAVLLMATANAKMPCWYEIESNQGRYLLAFKNEVHTGKSAGTALYTVPNYEGTASQWGDPGKPVDNPKLMENAGCYCDLFGVECNRGSAPPKKDSQFIISIDLPCPGVYPNETRYDLPLNGVLPEAAADLVYLESLALTGNALTGTLPDSWSVLTRLKALRLAGNKLTGTVPDSWSNMESLNYLDLSGNPMACYYQPEWLLEWGMKASNTLRITEPALCTGYRPPKRSPPSLPPLQPEPPGLPPPLRKPPPVTPPKPPPVVVTPKTTPSAPPPAPPPEPLVAAPSSSFPVAAAAVPAVLGSVAILSAAGWVLLTKYGGLQGVSELFSSLTSGFGKPFGGAGGAGAGGSSFMGSGPGPDPSPYSPAPAPAASPSLYYSTPSPSGLAYPPAATTAAAPAPTTAAPATRAAASYVYTAAAAAADPALLTAPAAGSSPYYIPAAEQAMYSTPPPAPSPAQAPVAPAPPPAPPAASTMPATPPPNLTSPAGLSSTYLESAASGASYSDTASAMPPPSAPSSQLPAASSGTDTAGMVADGLDMLSKGLDHAPGRNSSMLSSGTSALSSAINLATNGGDLLSKDTLDLVLDLVDLAREVREASQRVDANHARCKLLAERIQALLPLLERVHEVAESDPQLRQELQPLLLRVEQVLRDCHSSMHKWNKGTGANGVGLPAALAAAMAVWLSGIMMQCGCILAASACLDKPATTAEKRCSAADHWQAMSKHLQDPSECGRQV